MTGWIRNILSTEQKKSDFRPEEHEVGLVERTMVMDLTWNLKESINRRKNNKLFSLRVPQNKWKVFVFPATQWCYATDGGFGRIELFSIECHKTKSKTKPITYQLDSVLSQSQTVVQPELKPKYFPQWLLSTFNWTPLNSSVVGAVVYLVWRVSSCCKLFLCADICQSFICETVILFIRARCNFPCYSNKSIILFFCLDILLVGLSYERPNWLKEGLSVFAIADNTRTHDQV